MHMFGPLEEAGASQAHRVVTSLFLVCVQVVLKIMRIFNSFSHTIVLHDLLSALPPVQLPFRHGCTPLAEAGLSG